MTRILLAALLGVAFFVPSAQAWVSTCGAPRTIASVLSMTHPVIAWAGTIDVPEAVMGQSTVDAIGFWNPDSDSWVRIILPSDDLHCIYDSGDALPPWGSDV